MRKSNNESSTSALGWSLETPLQGIEEMGDGTSCKDNGQTDTPATAADPQHGRPTDRECANGGQADDPGREELRPIAASAKGVQVSAGQLCVIHVPRAVILEAMDGVLPKDFDMIVFSQWSEDKDSMTIGFARAPRVLAPEEVN